MLPEQQQRILGYFIEEARDHLNTIEQGLLNLQSTLNDPEMINEVFRAAHSIKGGAAMLGLSSIQHTSHRLEDCFKVLKENPIKVDQKLESLFLGVADTLKALLENLSGPFGLSEETANTLMSETEPVFQWLNQHLELLVQQANSGVDSSILAPAIHPAFADHSHKLTEIFMPRYFSIPEEDNSKVSQEAQPAPIVTTINDNWSEFQAQVLQTLREMLQLFKQGTTFETRQHLQQSCHQLVVLGETFNLPQWCKLCEAAENAIANPENTYLTLAKIVITEIKKAQELVLKGNEAEIVISQQLEVLLSLREVELFEITADLPDELATQPTPSANEHAKAIADDLSSPTMGDFVSDANNSITSLSELSNQLIQDKDIQTTRENTTPNISDLFNFLSSNEHDTVPTNHNIDPKGPEVGIAELNTLADLFEGETPELDDTWQQEEILDINAANKLGIDISSSDTKDADSDLADLLSFDEQTSIDESKQTIIQTEDFSLLFGENFLEKENSTLQPPQISATNSDVSNISKNEIKILISYTDESIREFTQILQEYPGDIAPQDVVQDLLGLELDENNLLSLGELNHPETEAIASIELFNKPEGSFDDLFSETAHESLVEEISPINFPQPESLSLDNLFTDLNESPTLSPEESEIEDLFEPQSTIARDFSPSAEDLSNFWNEEAGVKPQLEFDSLVEQDVAKALEESLFTAANDFFDDSQLAKSSASANFDLEDFNLTFQPEYQQFDLMFGADTGDDLFADLALDNTNISPAIGNRELPVTEIRSFMQEEVRASLPSTALPPEVLNFTPEFTNQPPTDKAFSSSSPSVGELETDLFDVINENSVDNPQLLFEDINTAHSTYIQLNPTEITISDTPELDLGDNLLAMPTNLEFNFIESLDLQQSPTNPEILGNFDTIETTVADTPELALGDDLLATPTNLEFNFSKAFELQQHPTKSEILQEFDTTEITISDTHKLDLGDDLLSTPTNLEFDFSEAFELQQHPTKSEILEEFDTTQTTVADTPELALGDDLLATPTDVELDFSEAFELQQPPTDIEGLGNFYTIEITVADTPKLALGDDLLATVSNLEFDFSEVSELQQPLTNLEIIDTTETNVADSAELVLLNDLLATETILQAEVKQEDVVDNTANIQDTNDAITENVVELDVLDEANDLSASLFNIAQTHEVATITEAENAVVSQTELDVPLAFTPEDEFAELETLLEEEFASPLQEEDFAALEALLDEDHNEELLVTPPLVYPQQLQPPTTYNNASTTVTSPDLDDEFGDLEKLLAEADQTISHSSSIKSNTGKAARPSTRRGARFEETMKVPVKQLDDMSNLVGELVVNRNTLEQDHERLRQSLDNLLIQVQQLSDVGARMQELYERSLLEASLLATRKHKDSGVPSHDSNSDRGFSELEMDRFTPFHTLSQEMIEMIVRVRESASDIDFVTEETERVARQFRQATTQLQEGLTRARMVPFSQAIDRLRRGVRDNAIKYGKQVELVIEGADTLIDKMILDHLSDPLTHMLNNAIAHGIETPEVRKLAGKNIVGDITIRAFHQGNQTVISVADDGAGIDPERIKAKALKLGMLTAEEAKTITRMEVYNLLFHSGFSIKDQADEISGRGVGMDIVRSEISEVRGTVNTDSAIGKGTTFTIRLPLTLSICKALCCVSDKARIAFPMDGVEDTLDIPLKSIQHSADGQTFIAWRDTLLPFRPLKELLGLNRQISRGSVYGGTRDDDMVSVVVVRSANNLLALQIDLVLSEQEIVIKQFEGPAPKPLGVAGATVLGDGRIMPIADVLEIMDIFQGRMSQQNGVSIWQQKPSSTLPEIPVVKIDPTVLIVDDSITVRELLSLTFNKAGYRVEQARDGQEAWDKLRSGLPCDIVFCDIEMPRCDGLELLSRIQKDQNFNRLPIAMLTSRGADKHRQMAIQLGASGYFTKPYLEEALLEAAVRMLKGEKLILNTTV